MTAGEEQGGRDSCLFENADDEEHHVGDQEVMGALLH